MQMDKCFSPCTLDYLWGIGPGNPLAKIRPPPRPGMPREAKQSLIGMHLGKAPTGEWPWQSLFKPLVFAKTNVAVVYLQACLIPDEELFWVQDRCPGIIEGMAVPELGSLEATAVLMEESDKEEPMMDRAP